MEILETKYWQLNSGDVTAAFAEAGALIRQGELVAFPTETVYGLGANGLDGSAVKKIYLAKGRPGDNPLILHIADLGQLAPLASELTPMARMLAERFWPGPLTLVVKKSALIPDEVSAGLDTVAVRFPSNEYARALIRAAGVPVAAPSANISGRPSPTNAFDVQEDMAGRIAGILDGGPCQVGLESTVVDTMGEFPVILRPGGITREMLQDLMGRVDLDPALAGESAAVPRAPGMKYKHYAPKAPMYLCRSQEILQQAVRTALAEGKKVGVVAPLAVTGCISQVYRDLPELANGLFYYLRELDRKAVDVIYGLTVPEEGLGLAIMNRMRKSAGGKII